MSEILSERAIQLLDAMAGDGNDFTARQHARSICEHLGITPGVVEAVTARVTTRPDGVTRAELIAADALATLLEAAGIER